MEQLAEGEVNATVSIVVIRACELCGGKREQHKPCATCGNVKPPTVHDLGVQSAFSSDPAKQQRWMAIGQHIAARRARQANKEANRGNRR